MQSDKTHVLKYVKWLPCGSTENYFIIVNGDDVYQVVGGSPRALSTMRRNYPIRIEHDVTLSNHRGVIEFDQDLVRFRIAWPEIYAKLEKYYTFNWECTEGMTAMLKGCAPRTEEIDTIQLFARMTINPRERAAMFAYVELARMLRSWADQEVRDEHICS